MFERIILFRKPGFLHIERRLAVVLLAALSLQLACLPKLQAQTVNKSSPVPQEVRTLEPGKPIDREIAGGQSHSYQLTMTAGQFVIIDIEQRAIDLFEQVLGPDGQIVAEFDNDWRPNGTDRVEFMADASGVYRLNLRPDYRGTTGSYELRVVELRAATERDRLLHEAHKLSTKSRRLEREGKYGEARALAMSALDAGEKALGSEDAFTAFLFIQLGLVQKDRGEYAEAEKSLQRATTMSERLLGPEHPQTAYAMNTLGLVYRAMHDFARASSLLQRSVEITDRTLGPENGRLGVYLNNLSNLHFDMGDLSQAGVELERAFRIGEKTLPPVDIEMATRTSNLGNLYRQRGDYARAEPLLERGIAINEELFGPNSPNVANGLQNLGIIARQKKDYERAIALYQRALAIREKTVGPEHPNVAALQNNIANIYHAKGDYAKALEIQQRALAIAEKAVGPYHGLTLTLLANIARTYMALGDLNNAIQFQTSAEAGQNVAAELDLAIGSERQKLAYIGDFGESSSRTISLNLNLAPTDHAAANLAALVLLQRKGRVLDAMSDSLAALHQRSNPEDQKLLDHLNATTTKLAQLELDGPGKMVREDYQKQVAALEGAKEKLESEISERSAEFRAQSAPVTVAAVQSLIPANSALIEFGAFRPFDPKAVNNDEAFGSLHYAAYVLRSDGTARGRDLGDAKAIDDAIDSWRRALSDPTTHDTRTRARAVDEKVMRPLRELLGGATHLLVSPDGGLNLLPFAALVDEEGRYLIQRYTFTYLTSGRDLLRMQVARESKSKPLLIANPNFGEPASELFARSNANVKSTARGERRRSVTTGNDLSEVYFAPLSGTEQEARSIQTLFPEAAIVSGAQATKSAVKQINAPRILHVATHGFFLSELRPVATSSPAQTTARSADAGTVSPLLRSGLALTGANLHNANDDGVLTALEASGLNLWGTKLVVLSACDTGVGEVRNGEGVYGLRRAFVLAGAESLVMSLWPISDYPTRQLMTGYYRNLKQGMGRGEALRQVQLDMVKKNPNLHPFYWANFIQAGEWANLEGKR